MSMTAPQIIVDPLHALVADGFVSGTKRPIPLVATRFNVDLNHGLATVSATRTFKNTEETSIEATITRGRPGRSTQRCTALPPYQASHGQPNHRTDLGSSRRNDTHRGVERG